jgi:hypothetical protein
MLTVKELRVALEALPDDMPVVIFLKGEDQEWVTSTHVCRYEIESPPDEPNYLMDEETDEYRDQGLVVVECPPVFLLFSEITNKIEG